MGVGVTFYRLLTSLGALLNRVAFEAKELMRHSDTSAVTAFC